jgi:hypothetical protein
MGASNQVGIGLSYRPASLHSLADSIQKSLKIPAQFSTAGAGANGKKIFIEKSKVHPKPPTGVFGRMFPMLTTDTENKATVSRDFFINHLPQTEK